MCSACLILRAVYSLFFRILSQNPHFPTFGTRSPNDFFLILSQTRKNGYLGTKRPGDASNDFVPNPVIPRFWDTIPKEASLKPGALFVPNCCFGDAWDIFYHYCFSAFVPIPLFLYLWDKTAMRPMLCSCPKPRISPPLGHFSIKTYSFGEQTRGAYDPDSR